MSSLRVHIERTLVAAQQSDADLRTDTAAIDIVE
jgi:hypothetical protein